MWAILDKRCLSVALLLASPYVTWAQGELEIGAFVDTLGDDAPSVALSDSATPLTQLAMVPSELATEADSPSHEEEIVRDRFKNGQIHIEKQMRLDDEGNYVNHGFYREYSVTGEVIVEGNFEMGKAQGSWIKKLSANESRHVQQQLGVAFKPPFMSTIEFAQGLPHKIWTITDQDQKTIVHIELDNGLRHGIAAVYLPSGELKNQSTFDRGILSGSYIERREGNKAFDAMFVSGRRSESEVLYHPNRKIKSKHEYLTSVFKVGDADDWNSSTFAKLMTEGERELHGEFLINHEDGSLATRGNYHHGKLMGLYESRHRNGEIAATGEYRDGQREGTWVWRYPNGMKETQTVYKDGNVVGKVLAWDSQGRATLPKEGHSNSAKRIEVNAVSRSILITE